MRILIEEHQYQAEQIRDVLYGIDAMQDIDGNVSINYVGYYYNTQLNDCVFILPKVLLEDTPEVGCSKFESKSGIKNSVILVHLSC